MLITVQFWLCSKCQPLTVCTYSPDLYGNTSCGQISALNIAAEVIEFLSPSVLRGPEIRTYAKGKWEDLNLSSTVYKLGMNFLSSKF